ncbi:Maf family protein [Gallaecimonas pentaromativorans]|uniref:Maf family protein n=1 Tax=Gallaecimonas pentaromativorans TaxID=584787 RepID=UPI00067F4F82|nr:nucleoside triphosphate pyrophosphatase [Gallaecimonas pentaromativorans]MED5527022.1 nucleoside triphosphate pyrophosphatase [Pseudomonadota bacterium]
MAAPALYLASSSPRRRQLLALLDLPFEVLAVDVDESALPGESPLALVERLARAKAEAGAALAPQPLPVLGSDTVGELDGQLLVKPVDEQDAARMMRAMSGRSHFIHTAIAFSDGRRTLSHVVTSAVTFKPLSDPEIAAYWQSGEPADKAGGYGIQGRGGRFVSHLSGSYFAVVGLPLMETERLLNQFLGKETK